MIEKASTGLIIEEIDDRQARHQNHLCWLLECCPFELVASLARDGQYICRKCGRVAASAENLCDPVRLNP
ncbi:MAG: hypothetical protein ACYC1C_04730 [Chloroflexota bacterium]